MFLKIAENKARYDKGQIFPFLIAILVVVIIIAMITVNLGQIGIFRTDVSNAADSAALAGASVLSGYLLGIGLQSDMMSGQMVAEVTGLIVSIVAGVSLIVGGAASEDPETVKKGVKKIIAAISLYIATWIKSLVTYLLMLEDGKMAWSNAKKTALQYAFQNAGIDEPRPTFKQFVAAVYGKDADNLTTEEIKRYNEVYFMGDDPDAGDGERKKIKRYTQNGFSRFMEGEGGRGGYWDEEELGKIKPGHISPPIITTGYGWSVNDQGGVTNSYDNGGNYINYDNYVRVEVAGSVMYPLRIYMGANLIKELKDELDKRIDDAFGGKGLVGVFADIIVAIFETILSPVLTIVSVCPAGLMMDNIKQQTDDNLISVSVRRHKKDSDVGLWAFRYGNIDARARCHAYRENDQIDIKPLIKDDIWRAGVLGPFAAALGCVLAAAALGIGCSLLVTAGRTVCVAASAACLVLAPVCIAACWVAAALLHIACAAAMVKGIELCTDAYEKNALAKKDQVGLFDTTRHLFETELVP